MPKRLLLVDDEEFFLRSLKDGLASLSNIFETDICYSVNEAIKHVVTKSYDLLITDIRMPGKTGIDLLIYLREMRFKGKVMVMSAYNTNETSKQIKSCGVVDLISKPFKLEWFKNMLLERFQTPEAPGTITFETIDLITVMQIIHMEKKTSALEVDNQGIKGMIYFYDGEIIHAEYNDLEGERAILKMISLGGANISVKSVQGKIRRTMEVPFVEYMMNIMKTIDEIRRDQKDGRIAPTLENENIKENITENEEEIHLLEQAFPHEALESNKYEHQVITHKQKENTVAVNEILKELTDVKGYLGAGVFTPQGELLEGTSEISGIHFEQAGSLIHDALSDAKRMTREIGFGNLDMLQFYSEMGIIFAVCFEEGGMHFHTILVIKTDGNIAMAKLKLKKVVDLLKLEF